jgi:hypothetical protein
MHKSQSEAENKREKPNLVEGKTRMKNKKKNVQELKPRLNL